MNGKGRSSSDSPGVCLLMSLLIPRWRNMKRSPMLEILYSKRGQYLERIHQAGSLTVNGADQDALRIAVFIRSAQYSSTKWPSSFSEWWTINPPSCVCMHLDPTMMCSHRWWSRWTATAGSFGNFGLFINIACMRVNNRTIKWRTFQVIYKVLIKTITFHNDNH